MTHEGDRMSYSEGWGHSEGGSHALQGAVIGAVAKRLPIAVAGPDRATYLQGLLTNDIVALAPGTGCYSAWLTAQGRMLTDLFVLESGDMILLDVPEGEHAATLARLEQFLFAEDVQLSDLAGALTPVWVHGLGAPAIVEQSTQALTGLADWAQYRNARTTMDGHPVVVARIDQLGVPGFCLYVEPAQAAAVLAVLESTGASRMPAENLETARVEAGYPLFGIDMTHDTIPLEAGIEARAISATKGCYVGQEVIIRVLHRGHGRVARHLVSMNVEDGVPARGARAFSGEREIGRVTSAVRSPERGPIALGYLQRDFLQIGTAVEVEVDSHRCQAVVTSVLGS
jgi:folate-binding protein YgfZ